MVTAKKHISLDLIDPLNLLGQNDRNLSLIEQHYGVRAVVRGNDLWLSGPAEAVAKAGSTLTALVAKVKRGDAIEDNDLTHLFARGGAPPTNGQILKTYRGSIKARSPGQVDYFDAIDNNDIVFAIGPAGTGKTYLAVASAVAALRQKQVTRIVLARPAVEAGESLGFFTRRPRRQSRSLPAPALRCAAGPA